MRQLVAELLPGGGKRKGALAVYLEPWHADVFEFLELRKNHGKEEQRARCGWEDFLGFQSHFCCLLILVSTSKKPEISTLFVVSFCLGNVKNKLVPWLSANRSQGSLLWPLGAGSLHGTCQGGRGLDPVLPQRVLRRRDREGLDGSLWRGLQSALPELGSRGERSEDGEGSAFVVAHCGGADGDGHSLHAVQGGHFCGMSWLYWLIVF